MAPAQAAVEYVGTFCPYLKGMGAEQSYSYIRFDVLDYGTNTFPVHGALVDLGLRGSQFPVHGTAIVDEMKLKISLAALQCGYRPYQATFSIAIDLSTFEGSYELTTVELPDLPPP